jgi:hypothetical protein
MDRAALRALAEAAEPPYIGWDLTRFHAMASPSTLLALLARLDEAEKLAVGVLEIEDPDPVVAAMLLKDAESRARAFLSAVPSEGET